MKSRVLKFQVVELHSVKADVDHKRSNPSRAVTVGWQQRTSQQPGLVDAGPFIVETEYSPPVPTSGSAGQHPRPR